MSAIVDGVSWTAQCVEMQISVGSSYTAIGTSVAGSPIQYVAVALPINIGIGTFPLLLGQTTINATTYASGFFDPGTATITTRTATNIAGTFSFTASGKAVTGGRFNITFTP